MGSETKIPVVEKSWFDFCYERVLPLLFWIALHLLVILYLFVADTAISREVQDDGPFIQTVVFLVLVVATGLLFVRTSTMDPGRIQVLGEGDKDKNPQPVDPSARFCPVCNHWQKLRSKHCRLCQCCVAKYDHHCYWMGNCIGEKNHASFWWFLVVQCTVLIWALSLVIESIAGTSPHSPQEFVRDNIVGVLLVIKMLIVGWLPLALLGLHSYLICTNQTTWEFNVRSRITYLRGFPEGFNPFSQGCWGNVELACLDFDPEPKYWRPLMKAPPPVDDEVEGNPAF